MRIFVSMQSGLARLLLVHVHSSWFKDLQPGAHGT